ncbi:MAG: 16S rRNA (cytosine(1402)-N(4))-methyltransferase RsmH [Parvularculaceae bacterium]|nr:16S rRNA (cytosine(1402)-N(4))-methyltransferase RsmH [Parvularculaceae bacterium]
MTASGHAPVLLDEALAALAPINHGVYVDATFGGGGYTRAVLGAANCAVYAFDRDPTAIARARDWAGAYGGRLTLVNRPFAEIEEALGELGVDAVNGVVFDLGVSSMQLDEAERGFSFMREGPLSMRMDGGKPDAADVVNGADARDLAAIFKVYGEEKKAGRIARAIVAARAGEPITTTTRLAGIISQASPARPGERIHPATRVFQALRIFVNNELGQLARALVAAERLLAPAGRLVVVTFHSLEDRIVKRFLTDRSGAAARPSRHAPAAQSIEATFKLLNAKPQTPRGEETDANPRARSSKLRAAIRTGAAASDFDFASLPPRLDPLKSLAAWR